MLCKIVPDHQREWHERLLEELSSHRTSAQLSTRVTPFMQVYGTKAILPMEVELLASLEAIDEHRGAT